MESSKLSHELSDALIKSSIPTRGSTRKPLLGSDLCTFKIGGPIRLLIEPTLDSEVVSALKIVSEFDSRPYVLGEGSNLLIPDAGIDAPVIHPRNKSIVTDDVRVIVDAGFSVMSLSRQLSDAGLSGLEFAGGIPGAVGGALFMNAGAHGACFGDVAEWIEVATHNGIERIQASSLPWHYRHSGLSDLFDKVSGVVVRAGLLMTRSDAGSTTATRAKYLAERRAKQPLQAASAGSVFRNPSVELSAGAVVEKSGLKGFKIGGALVSPLHANWIINPERTATADDVGNLIEHIKAVVKTQTGISLREELVRWKA